MISQKGGQKVANPAPYKEAISPCCIKVPDPLIPCLPSMWVLCAFFEIIITAIKLALYLFQTEATDNQHPNIRITHQPHFAHSPN